MERVYTINLRKGFLSAPRYKRAKKAMNYLKEFLGKHLKTEKIKISGGVNEYIWKRGIKNPPPKIKVIAVGDEKEIEVMTLEEKVEREKESKKKKSNRDHNTTEKKGSPSSKKVGDDSKTSTREENSKKSNTSTKK